MCNCELFCCSGSVNFPSTLYSDPSIIYMGWLILASYQIQEFAVCTHFVSSQIAIEARIHDILKELNVKGIFYNSPLTSFNISSLPQLRNGAWDTNLVEMANKKRPHIPEAGVWGVNSRRRKGQLNRSPKWFSIWDGSLFLNFTVVKIVFKVKVKSIIDAFQGIRPMNFYSLTFKA